MENEYGSYSTSKLYMKAIRDIIKEHVGDNALLYTTDGQYRSYFYDGSVPGALTTIDFGPTSNRKNNLLPIYLILIHFTRLKLH